MPSGSKPYTIAKLHSFSERCWAVIDSKGAVVDFNGLFMKLTKAEASTYAQRWNGDDDQICGVKAKQAS